MIPIPGVPLLGNSAGRIGHQPAGDSPPPIGNGQDERPEPPGFPILEDAHILGLVGLRPFYFRGIAEDKLGQVAQQFPEHLAGVCLL